MSLCKVINDKANSGESEWQHAVSAWEREVLEQGELERLRAIVFASVLLRSWFWRWVNIARYISCLCRQKVRHWVYRTGAITSLFEQAVQQGPQER